MANTASERSDLNVKLWLPPLSPKDQEKLSRLQNKKKEAIPSLSKMTGFAGKTLWDWLKLYGLLIGAIGTLVASMITTIQTNETALYTSKLTMQLTYNQEQSTTLHTYMDQISDLVLDKNLDVSKPNDIVQKIARVKTLTALRELDDAHKGLLLRFLYELGLITVNNAKVDLSNADLSGADLHGLDLSNTDLHETVLSNANLSGTDLNGANLSGAQVTNGQLKQAKSLTGATMPDGAIHDAIPIVV